MTMTFTFATLLVLFVLFTAPAFSQAPPRNGRGRGALSALRRPRPGRSVCRRVDCRTLTGECTSTTDPSWGRARLAQFSYTGSTSRDPGGAGLRSAREISNIVFDQTTDIPNERGINQLFVFFGQFLDHNFVSTPTNTDGEQLNIQVPADDPELPPGSTLSFTRSERGDPATDAERPINSLPSAVDLVAVYGPSQMRNTDLREFDANGNPTGRLRVSTDGENLLPRNTNGLFNAPDSTADFFIAGDHRVNEHPALTAMHTVFVRQHNRLVEMVDAAIPGLLPETLYDYARKLNIAQYQKIVYEEFFPAIMGRPGRLPRFRGFRPNVDPTVSDIFAGAAFRIGHTMVGDLIPRAGPRGSAMPPVPLGETFFRLSDTFTNSEFDSVVRGIANTVAQEVDAKVVNTLRNFLFENVTQAEGFDLVALNLQRSRDHNLPSYNEIRDVFGLRRVRSFADIPTDAETRAQLRQAYDDVDDIEPFVGLLAESRVPGSSVGETMMAVWREEFRRVRDGDRFFYLNERTMPLVLRRRMVGFFRDLRNPRVRLFRDILVATTGVSARDLPSARRIFFV